MNRFCGTAARQWFTTVFSLAIIWVFTGFPQPAMAEETREITLEEAYHSALQHNERIMASRYRVEQAKEDIRIARSPVLPQFSLEGKSVRFKETDPVGGFRDLAEEMNIFLPDMTGPDRFNEATIKGSQVLFHGGKLRIAIQASRYVAESSTFEDYRVRQQVLYGVSRSFYNVLFARRAMEIGESQLTRSNQHLELARQRQEVGLVDMTAVLRARVQVAAAMEALEQARNNYTVAGEQLALDMGIPIPPASVREPEAIEMADVPVETHIENAFANRRDLMATEKWLLASQMHVEAERRDFLPVVSLEGSYSVIDKEELYSGDHYDWQVALVARYPLFTGLKNTAEVAKARARESEMQAAYNRTKQEVRLDVRAAYADIQTRKKMVQHIGDQVDAAKAHYEQVSAKFEEGLASTVDVVDAHTALNEAELSLATVYYRLQLDQLRLQVATGTFLQAMLE